MRIFLLVFLLYTALSSASAQRFWRFVPEQHLAVSDQAERPIRPLHLQALELDAPAVLSLLAHAPMEFTKGATPVTLDLPTADGGVRTVSVWESPVMAPALAAKFPAIRTYAGYSTDGALVRLGTDPDGFYAFTFTSDGAIQTVRPYATGQQQAYMAYHLRDLPKDELLPGGRFLCGTEDQDINITPVRPSAAVANRGSGAPVNLKKYRTAISAQAEYSAFHGNTKNTVMNAVVVAMNFIGAIYERDMAIRLELIPNNDTLFYYDVNTDPYFGTGAADWRGQNPAATNARIDLEDYDIGHVFCRILNPPGGVYVAGQASLSSVCTEIKAAGASSLPSPVGENYYLIIAHEMGHQHSATHSFNSCPPAADARTGFTAFEPGGGSTIMSYGGVCAPDIVENDQDGYFHVANLEQMTQYVTLDNGSACGENIATGNTAPELTIPLTDGFYIPISTPFALTGTVVDPDGDNLTYCWEQYDTGPETPLGQPVGSAPSFRSFPPSASPTRTFPRLPTIIANTSNPAEVLPTYNRELNFKLTVRDNHPGGGGTDWEAIKFRSTTQAGPFRVTDPNALLDVWVTGDYEVVTWDVANTNKGLVNCQKVNIHLSTDGGLTYPIELAAGVPNSGFYCVQVPNTPTNKARVRVSAADNIFFDISNADFKVQAPAQPAFSMCTAQYVDTLCLPDAYTLAISTSAVQGFSEPVNLSFASPLAGAVATFTPNPVMPGEDAVLTLSFPAGHPEGTFNVNISGTAAGITDSSVVSLYLVNNDFSPIALMTPTDGALGQDVGPWLRWSPAIDANTYDIQVATNPSFSPASIVVTYENVAIDSVKVLTLLDKGAVYYWRVRPKNECGIGEWVGPNVFATLVNVCAPFASNDIPKNISGSQVVTVESKLTVPATGAISDVNITKVAGSHTFFKDLEMHLIGPTGIDVLLFKDKCASYSGLFDMGFDDSKGALFGCPPPKDGTTSKPTESLGAFNGKNANGDWILRVKDNTIGSGGQITGFALELCFNAALNPPILVNNNVLTVAPGTNKAISTDLLKTEDANNTDQQLVYTLVSLPKNGELQLNWTGPLSVGAQFTQAELNNNSLGYFDYGFSGKPDEFCFTVTDGEGGLIKDCFTIQPFPLVGTNEPGTALDFLLAPNPASESLRVIFGQAPDGDTRIRMFDTAGRLVRQSVLPGGQASTVLPVTGLPAGIYTVAVENSTGSGVRKVVVRN